jgi:Zn-dependent peptidase ImmA (M78 family)
MRVKELVRKLVQACGTSDPFQIAEMKHITVLYEHLGKSTWGYYSCVNRIPIIHLQQGMARSETSFTCAHELGHHILHPQINTPFLRANTLLSIDRIEREANEFAVELLIPDKLLFDGASLFEAAQECGVPEEVVHLKRKPMRNFWRNEDSYFSV